MFTTLFGNSSILSIIQVSFTPSSLGVKPELTSTSGNTSTNTVSLPTQPFISVTTTSNSVDSRKYPEGFAFEVFNDPVGLGDQKYDTAVVDVGFPPNVNTSSTNT